MKTKTRINQSDQFFIVTQTIIGVAILSLPFQVFKEAAQDSWISAFISGVATVLLIVLIWSLCRRFPNLTFFEFSKVILGKALGNCLNFFYTLYLLIIVSYTIVMIDDILTRWVFPETPEFVLLIVGVLFFIYSCRGEIKHMIYLFSLLFIFILVMVGTSFIMIGKMPFDIRYLFPIAQNGVEPILKGSVNAFPVYFGYETLLVYFAFIKHPKRLTSIKGSIFGLIFTTLFYVYIVFQSIIFFSPGELEIIPEPVLYMLRSINIHLLQRIDLVFLSIWGIVVAGTLISYGYIGSMGVSKLVRVKHSIAVILAAIVVFIVSYISYAYLQQINIWKIVFILNVIFGIIIPTALLLISYIFNRKASPQYENQ